MVVVAIVATTNILIQCSSGNVGWYVYSNAAATATIAEYQQQRGCSCSTVSTNNVDTMYTVLLIVVTMLLVWEINAAINGCCCFQSPML